MVAESDLASSDTTPPQSSEDLLLERASAAALSLAQIQPPISAGFSREAKSYTLGQCTRRKNTCGEHFVFCVAVNGVPATQDIHVKLDPGGELLGRPEWIKRKPAGKRH